MPSVKTTLDGLRSISKANRGIRMMSVLHQRAHDTIAF